MLPLFSWQTEVWPWNNIISKWPSYHHKELRIRSILYLLPSSIKVRATAIVANSIQIFTIFNIGTWDIMSRFMKDVAFNVKLLQQLKYLNKCFKQSNHPPAGNFMFKVNNRNSCFGVSIVNFEQVNDDWVEIHVAVLSTTSCAKSFNQKRPLPKLEKLYS